VTQVDANMLGRVRQNAVRHTTVLKWMEAASKTYCNCEALRVWLFDGLHHLTVTCTLKTMYHKAYFFFSYGATAPNGALAYLHETLRFTSVFLILDRL
jgi:hypothetical protein